MQNVILKTSELYKSKINIPQHPLSYLFNSCFIVDFLTPSIISGKLWRRDQTTRTFPEGTKWIETMDGLSDISLGNKNDVSQCFAREIQQIIITNGDNLRIAH